MICIFFFFFFIETGNVFAQDVKLQIDNGAHLNILEVGVLQGIGNDGYLECVICGIAYRERYAVDGDRTLVNGEIATKCHFLVLGILEGEVGRTIGIFFLDAGGCLVYVALNDVAVQSTIHNHRALDIDFVAHLE